ncbi:hypothetical protein DPMN_128206 [Dreissena polymorpha]|uniref:Cadherin domain-containing protein n=1 Tax=Dreissena polymorpha TaxID=45954 RepID=A0A9D4H6P3_DREPO|nr:hypothetical protein DPMN_128206 [Dreissena polymorpha]
MLSCTPNATCPFMSPNGDIVTNADLHSYPNNSFQLSVVATDKYNKNPTPYTVIVEITDINTVPKLTNVPKIDV